MKKSFKGFTLIECLIALAVLGIASLTMAQIYANVANRNRQNHLLNTSLSNQMAYVEKYTGAEAVAIYYNGTTSSQPDPNATSSHEPPKKSGSGTHSDMYVTIVRVKSDGTNSLDTDQTYSYPVDTFVLYSRDSNNVNSIGKDENGNNVGFGGQYEDYLKTNNKEDQFNLRYKYLVGHSNSP